MVEALTEVWLQQLLWASVGLGGPATRASLVGGDQDTACVMKGDALQGAREGKDQHGGHHPVAKDQKVGYR